MKKFRKLNFVFVLISVLFSLGAFARVDAAANTFTKEFDFVSSGTMPIEFLTKASDGMLYGTAGGGANSGGIIFQYNPNTNTYTKKYDFNSTDGSMPYGALIVGQDGLLYGRTSDGGANDLGVIFQYDPATNTYTKKYDLDITIGMMAPNGSMVRISDGSFYGMTRAGGDNSRGTIFQYDPTTNVYTTKYSFASSPDGSSPVGSLILASDGKLYGMTSSGGANNLGILFQYDPTGEGTYTKKYDFISASGSNPKGSLTLASDGKLYGMTSSGGANSNGVIFQYDPTGEGTYTDKYDFVGTIDGANPEGSLILSSDNKLYGVTKLGGANNLGAIFQYDPATNTYTKKYDFATSPDGSRPSGDLVEVSDGVFYGTTVYGGASYSGGGIIFQYTLATDTYAKKHDFAENPYGAFPNGSMIKASDGMFYGVTSKGGMNMSPTASGIIFQYNPTTGVFTDKYNFNSGSSGGYKPLGSLVEFSDHKLYGMTSEGGSYSAGVIFQYDPATSTYTSKYDFDDDIDYDGQAPSGSLSLASDGKLYGMTKSGGTNSSGVIFQYDPTTNTYTKKYDFAGNPDGSSPYDSLVSASDGKLYGMTFNGGANNLGIIFQYDPTGEGTYTKKYDFSVSDGVRPSGSLTLVSDGKLYGMTSLGGANSKGTIFQYDPATNTYLKLYDFAGVADGSTPKGSLALASDGKLYGMTSLGGENNKGVLFQYDLVTKTYLKLYDFVGTTDGANPVGSLIDTTDGSLYGLSYYGGIDNLGTIFKWEYEVVVIPTPTPTPVRSRTHSSSGTTAEVIAKFKQTQVQDMTNSGTGTSTSTGSGWTHRTLKLKMTGDDVKTLQAYLNNHNYPLSSTGVGSLGKETTYFGTLTKQAVIKFQLANSLVGDGIVGPKTWAKIDSIK